MEEPGRLQSMGSLGVGHDWGTSLSLFTFMLWRRKWQPTPPKSQWLKTTKIYFFLKLHVHRGSARGPLCSLWSFRYPGNRSSSSACVSLITRAEKQTQLIKYWFSFKGEEKHRPEDLWISLITITGEHWENYTPLYCSPPALHYQAQWMFQSIV